MLRLSTRALLTTTAAAACAASAHAQPFRQVTYSDVHVFSLSPDPMATAVSVSVSDFRHAWVKAGPWANWGVVSNTQDPDFDPFGTDTFLSPTSVNSGLFGVPVPCNYDVHPVTPAGLNASICLIVDVLPQNSSSAAACNSWTIAPFSTTPPFTIAGTIESSGGAQASLSGVLTADAYAFSSTAVTVVGGRHLASGQIMWGLSITSDAVGQGGGASVAVRRGDPIHFIATNSNTGEVVDAVVLDVTFDADGQGVADWDAGTLHIDTLDAELLVSIPQAFVAPGQGGHIALRVEGGMVTLSDDSGAFDGLMPPLGTPVPITLPLPTDFTLDYDLGLDPADPWDVVLTLSGGADARPRAGCPADINADGVLNLDDVDAFISAFLEGDVAVADLDGNGTINLDDLDVFIDSFLSGCPEDGGEG